MEDIAKMADECLRDVDEDDEDANVEEDQDLLVFAPDFNGFLNPCLCLLQQQGKECAEVL